MHLMLLQIPPLHLFNKTNRHRQCVFVRFLSFFLSVLQQVRQLFPQFNETNDKGQHSQQDADECYSQLMLMLLSKLKGEESRLFSAQQHSLSSDIRITVAGTTFQDRFESLFEGQLAQEYFLFCCAKFTSHMFVESRIKCLDSDVIPATHKLETFRRLQCHITINTNHLHEGIKAVSEKSDEIAFGLFHRFYSEL